MYSWRRSTRPRVSRAQVPLQPRALLITLPRQGLDLLRGVEQTRLQPRRVQIPTQARRRYSPTLGRWTRLVLNQLVGSTVRLRPRLWCRNRGLRVNTTLVWSLLIRMETEILREIILLLSMRIVQ